MNEHEHQCHVITWSQKNLDRLPDLDLLFAIANAGAGRQKGQAGKMKAEGVKPGVPDLCLPVALGSYHGLYIEMKTEDSGPSDAQKAVMARLQEQGYYVAVAQGAEIAIMILETYLAFPPTRVLSEKLWQACVAGEATLAFREMVPENIRPVRCRLAASILPLRQCMLNEGHEPPCVPDDRPRIPK